MKREGHLRLGAVLSYFGAHSAAWRHPATSNKAFCGLDRHVDTARAAERGLFDFLFMADGFSVEWPNETPDTLGRRFFGGGIMEPFSVLAAIASHTKHIGLIATSNTTYCEPFHVARVVASLDHLSNGRAGWNLVTGTNPMDAGNFGHTSHPQSHDRYERAAEFAQVVFGLWETWDEDAFVCDKEKGQFFEPAKMHLLNHKGKFFSVRGPLNVPRSPQGRPVTCQAGASEEGRSLAAAVGDIVFATAQTLPLAKAFYADIKGRAAKVGRAPGDLLILPGVLPFVGRTDSEARQKLADMEACLDVELALKQLGLEFGVNLSVYPLDEPFPELDATKGWSSLGSVLQKIAAKESLTLRQMLARFSLRHWQLAGTPASIADIFQEWYEAEACDGFMVSPPYLPGSLDDFVTLVIPELQRRGLFRKQYEGTTLRDRLGLQSPGVPA